MNAYWPEPDRRELVVAGAAGIIWALLGLTLAAHGADLNPPPSKGGAKGGIPDRSQFNHFTSEDGTLIGANLR
jgi:hypothetical protein